VLFGYGFTEMQELADLPAELRQIVVFVDGQVFRGGHIYIVSRYTFGRQAVRFVFALYEAAVIPARRNMAKSDIVRHRAK
jgi:hypothetical protein